MDFSSIVDALASRRKHTFSFDRDVSVTGLVYERGLTLKEVVELRRDQYEDGRIHLGLVEVTLSDVLQQHIESWLNMRPGGEYLFCTKIGRRLDQSHFRHIFNELHISSPRTLRLGGFMGREWRIGSGAIPYIFVFPALSNYVQHIVVDEKLSYIYVFSAANIAYVGNTNNPAVRYSHHLAGRGRRSNTVVEAGRRSGVLPRMTIIDVSSDSTKLEVECFWANQLQSIGEHSRSLQQSLSKKLECILANLLLGRQPSKCVLRIISTNLEDWEKIARAQVVLAQRKAEAGQLDLGSFGLHLDAVAKCVARMGELVQNHGSTIEEMANEMKRDLGELVQNHGSTIEEMANEMKRDLDLRVKEMQGLLEYR